MFLTVRDTNGDVVRHIAGSTSKGMHRATWNYRHTGYTPAQTSGDSSGPLAVPGRYTVSVSTAIDGNVTQIAGPTEFEVEPLGAATIPEQDRAEVLAFQKKTGALQRAVMGAFQVAQESANQLKYMKNVIATTPGIDPKLAAKARELELRLQDVLERFSGDPTRPRRSEPATPGILSRVQTVVRGHWSTTHGPTNTHRKSYEIAADEFAKILGDLRKLVDKEMVALGNKLEAAGRPGHPAAASRAGVGKASVGWKPHGSATSDGVSQNDMEHRHQLPPGSLRIRLALRRW